jgi:hydrogenase nickel incorporation protein HypA/HybF
MCDVALDVARQHGATEVISLTCRIGVLRQVVPELMQNAFELASEGTLLQGATLKVETDGIEVACTDCGVTRTVYEIPFECPACGSSAIRCSGGQDITLTSIEVNEGVGDGDSGSQAARREEPG